MPAQLASRRTVFKDCKFNASATRCVTQTGIGAEVYFIRCDSGATNYIQEKWDAFATLTTETTIIRTGGATDGGQGVSHKIVSSANANFVQPFTGLPIVIWNESTSSITVTLYGVWGSGSLPNNDEVWFDAEYLGSSLTPLGSFVTCAKADPLASAAAQGSDTSTWGGSTTAFKLQVTFTPGMKGPITIYPKVGKASTTLYIDPKPEISGISVSRSFALSPGIIANEMFAGMPRSRVQLGQ